MPQPRSPYRAAWLLWRHAGRYQLRHPGSVTQRAVEVPARLGPPGLRQHAILALPLAPRGWVILAGSPDRSAGEAIAPPQVSPRMPRLAPALRRVGIGTLELPDPAGADSLEARVERLVAAADWLLQQPAVTATGPARLALAGAGPDAAAALLAAAAGRPPVSALVGIGGRYDGLDEVRLAGLTAPTRLIAAKDDATGLWQARQVLGWLATEHTSDLVVAPGTAAGFGGAGARQATWLAGAWLVEQLVMASRVAESGRPTPALAALRVGAALMPLASLALAWTSAPSAGPSAQAAPAGAYGRAPQGWRGEGAGAWTGGRLPVLKLDVALPGTIELSALNGTNGFRSNGITGGDGWGRAVSDAGDVNGDGFDDILIGALGADPNGDASGQFAVVYGGMGLPGTVELSALNGTNGFLLNGYWPRAVPTSDVIGLAVSGAGDVNDDGFDDILLATSHADPNGASSGQSFLVYGGPSLPGTIELAALNGSNGFYLNGISSFDESGRAVSGAGDVNADGFDDILIGAYGADPNGSVSGQTYVIYGRTGLPGTIELSALNGSNGLRVNGRTSGDLSGRAVSGAGDVNDDGFDDILIGASQSAVVYGGTGLPGTIELSALNGTNGFLVPGVDGFAVSGTGDVNADGFDDILIGTPYANPNGNNSGQSYVVYGGMGLPGTIELSALNGTNGFRVNGVSTSDRSGHAVSGAGDVNGDGFDDILIGAYRANPNGGDSGQSYVIYGGTGLPGTIELSALIGGNGFQMNGIRSADFSGFAASGAGDVNDDGFDDILIGAPSAGPNGTFSGQSYVVYGDAPPRPSSVSITDPFACTGQGDALTVEVVAVNTSGGPLTGATVQASLPVGLNGIPASCSFTGGSGSPSCVVGAGGMTWIGDMPTGDTLTIIYQVRIAAGVPGGSTLCIDTVFDPGIGASPSVTACTTVDCPPTAVDLRFFRPIGLADRVILAWETASELDTLGFDMLRAAAPSGPWVPVNPALVPAQGSAASGRTYILRDAPGPGTWYYRLEDIGADGKHSPHPAVEVRVGPGAAGRALFMPRAALTGGTARR